jgi:tetratricopeptide (TPR) repeat protein
LVLDPQQDVATAREAVAVLQRDGDEEGLARAWFALALAEWTQGQWDVMQDPLDRAIEHARRAESRSLEVHALSFLLASLTLGGTPIDEALRRADEYLEEWADSRELQGFSARMRGNLLAHQGRVEEGRALLEEARQIFAELGHREGLAILPFSTGRIELIEGDPVAAERALRSGVELMEEMGDRSRAASLVPLLADALTDQGRIDEAEELLERAREAAPEDDPNAEAFRRTAEARVLVRRGAVAEAVQLANEGIEMAKRTQELLTLPDLLVYQAEVLEMAGQHAAAEEALREAAEAAARKGSLGYVQHVNERLAALAGSKE